MIKDRLDAPDANEAFQVINQITEIAYIRIRDLKVNYISPPLRKFLGAKKDDFKTKFSSFILMEEKDAKRLFSFPEKKKKIENVPLKNGTGGMDYFDINVAKISNGWLVLSKFNPSPRDGLTGLESHKTFMDVASKIYAAANRVNGALILIDIDKFKTINDTHGHPQGDRALVDVATALLKTFRRGSDIIGRIGGDEFAVFFISTDSKKKLLPAVGERIKRLRENIKKERIDKFPVEISPGWKCFGEYHHLGTFQELMIKADESLYLAKSLKK